MKIGREIISQSWTFGDCFYNKWQLLGLDGQTRPRVRPTKRTKKVQLKQNISQHPNIQNSEASRLLVIFFLNPEIYFGVHLLKKNGYRTQRN